MLATIAIGAIAIAFSVAILGFGISGEDFRNHDVPRAVADRKPSAKARQTNEATNHSSINSATKQTTADEPSPRSDVVNDKVADSSFRESTHAPSQQTVPAPGLELLADEVPLNSAKDASIRDTIVTAIDTLEQRPADDRQTVELALADDATKTALDMAKLKHASTLSAAMAELLKAIGERIKEAALAGELTLVKELIAAKEETETSGAVPTHPKLTADVGRYVDKRRIAASGLSTAYQDAIRSYTSSKQAINAAVIETELKSFVANEQRAIAVSKENSDKSARAAKGTKELFAEFYKEYGVMMDVIVEQTTTAKREQMHRDLSRKLDEKIKGQTWDFHCEIADVKKSSNEDGTFVLLIELPAESPVFGEDWQRRTGVQNVRLSRQEGLDLSPGDVLVIRGTPRFSFDRDDYETKFFERDTQVGDMYVRHVIHLTKVKFSIEKNRKAR